MRGLEKTDVRVSATREEAELGLADEIASILRDRQSVVLGCATGNTPMGFYRELARRHREGELDLRRVRTFNLDEYFGLASDDPRSFRVWMRRHLFDPAGVSAAQASFPSVPPSVAFSDPAAIATACEQYERAIRDAGGIDLLLLGVGRNGHIAFNEPGSTRDSRTRIVELHPWTRADAARTFGGVGLVPTHAITMGVGTMLEARRIRLLAFGEEKRPLVARTLASTHDPEWPASHIAGHPDARVIVDRLASA